MGAIGWDWKGFHTAADGADPAAICRGAIAFGSYLTFYSYRLTCNLLWDDVFGGFGFEEGAALGIGGGFASEWPWEIAR